MKKHRILICLLLALNTAFAQGGASPNCKVEPGKGCGELILGKTRNEIESVFGKANSDRYYKNGFSLKYDAGDRVEQITLFLNRSEYIFQQYAAFPTILPGNQKANASIDNILATYGKPKTNRSFDALEAKITLLEYPGMQVYFERQTLFYVEIFKSSEAFTLRNDPSLFEDFTFGKTDTDPNANNNTNATPAKDSDGDGITDSEDMCPDDKGTVAGKGCPVPNNNNSGKEVSGNNQTAEKHNPDTPAADKGDKPAFGQKNCKYVIEDAGFRWFLGKKESDVNALLGPGKPNGEHSELGIQFNVLNNPGTQTGSLVRYLKVYNESENSGKKNVLMPGKKIDWNAGQKEIVSNYGEPDKTTAFGGQYDVTDLQYGDTLKIRLSQNKIYFIEIADPVYVAAMVAYEKKIDQERYLAHLKKVEEENKAKPTTTTPTKTTEVTTTTESNPIYITNTRVNKPAEKPKDNKCGYCGGSGKICTYTCPDCNNTGWGKYYVVESYGRTVRQMCGCVGAGMYGYTRVKQILDSRSKPCSKCGGTGKIR